MMMSKDELNLSDILVAKDLSKIRQSKGLSISEISEETGLTRSMISNIERSQNVGLYNIIKYADYLGYDDSTDESLVPLFDEKDYSALNDYLCKLNIKLIVKHLIVLKIYKT